MPTAKKGDTVLLTYIVKTADGTVVGKTEDDAPVPVTIGNAEIFPEVEAALDGLEVGKESAAVVSSGNAFGPRREEMVIDIPLAQLPGDLTPQPGMTLGAQQPDGSTQQLTITKVGEESVTVDGNHPLAGEDLHFGLTLVDIQTAA
ncbi:peptidylprolyl isomerase [Hyphobacterium sp. CCMP332]|uniref:FKBP-type peptidyl-prolyl cis-trans isomerase n=1 Tax=Hyphobacterium sp. CCMP332 TaxID=2749086 RepID=UPI00164EEFF4|nr:peptidylprolyl isomerase [Hyphobacterium sp. CCMP332]QNL19297.1 peptidylprolyl isomerase [Hyphobacterium sp. CCMP332]